MRLGGETRASFVNMHEAHHKNYCHRRFGYLHDVTFSACTFCFLISDHVMLLEGIVSFKCRLMQVQIYA